MKINLNIYMSKIIVRKKKCYLGNPTPGNLDGQVGSADLWVNPTENNKKKKE